MKTFVCRICESTLYFENSSCVTCGADLGFARGEGAIVPLNEEARYAARDGTTWSRCRNFELSGCTWLTPAADGLCSSCDLTRTRPADADLVGLSQFGVAEAAKRHLLVELDRLGLDYVSRTVEPETGLCFDMLSSVRENVVIGHAGGVITIDLAEGDDAHRVRVQAELDEPYRTMLGHLRHEVGHYIESTIVDPDLIERKRSLFGDETADYQAALDRHYGAGAPSDWSTAYISTYATMHPFEDFAETFAHMLHIYDTIDSARHLGLTTVEPAAFDSFSNLVTGVWMPLSTALNQINRSMGKDDLYPFVIPSPVLEKLDFVAGLTGVYGAMGQWRA